jgi:hypothetical protein
MRSARVPARAVFDWRGQLSSPAAVIRVAALPSAPNTSALTSLATIQSQPLWLSLRRAFPI